jgi:hypothetical protein
MVLLVRLFKRRMAVAVVLKRFAIVARVSPLLTVYRLRNDGSALGATEADAVADGRGLGLGEGDGLGLARAMTEGATDALTAGDEPAERRVIATTLNARIISATSASWPGPRSKDSRTA